ncbi:MAG: NB-ARC domain-containing protein [bacterium]
MDVLAVAAAIAGILAFVYVLIIGQKSIPEWWRDRNAEKHGNNERHQLASLGASSPRTVPHNLPHRSDFVGREKEKRQVHEALKSRSYIIMIGGIGKTSLALEVLHDCLAASQDFKIEGNQSQKFDAFIWTSAKDRELIINDMLDVIAHTLDCPFLTQLHLAEKRHEIAKRLQERPCLLVVDNFETVTDDTVQDFILNLPEPSKCLITSRTQSLRQARAVSIRGLAKEETFLLIENEGDRLGLDLKALTVHQINFNRFYEATGGAPLAIKWSIGQIRQRGQSIDGVLNSLHGARGDIFEFIFDRAWSLLSETSKKILLVMPIFASSASKAAIDAASEVHEWDLDEGLGQLVELWLLEASDNLNESKRRYSLHPLTRAFAQSRLVGNPILEHQARVRLVRFFENFAKNAGGHEYSWERYDEIEEEDNIFTLIDWCFKNERLMEGMRLTKSVTFFMSLRGYLYEFTIFGPKALEAARHVGYAEDLAWLLVHGIGWIELMGGNQKKGQAQIREGLKIFEELQNTQGIIWAQYNLGTALRFEGDYDQARKCYEKGMCLAESSNQGLAIASFKRGLAMLTASEGMLIKAREELEAIVPILREQNLLTLAGVLGDLAKVCYELRKYDAAFEVASQGLELARKTKKWFTFRWILKALVETEAERGNYQSALSFAQEAFKLYEKSGLFSAEIQELKALIEEMRKSLSS